MYLASASAVSSLESNTANFFSGFPLLGLSIHLSCAYAGHSSRKCCAVSLGCPQAGHCVLSANLNLCRYVLRGMCPEHTAMEVVTGEHCIRLFSSVSRKARKLF